MAQGGTVPEVFGFEIDNAVQLGPRPAMEELAIPQAQDDRIWRKLVEQKSQQEKYQIKDVTWRIKWYAVRLVLLSLKRSG